jgi:transcriptional regulator with XRE-family HTH domain
MTTAQEPVATPEPISIDLAYRVARNVRAEARRNGETQAQLAEVLGVAQQAVSARMTGKTPLTLRQLDALAAHWGMTPVDLIAGTPAPDNSGLSGSQPTHR